MTAGPGLLSKPSRLHWLLMQLCTDRPGIFSGTVRTSVQDQTLQKKTDTADKRNIDTLLLLTQSFPACKEPRTGKTRYTVAKVLIHILILDNIKGQTDIWKAVN